MAAPTPSPDLTIAKLTGGMNDALNMASLREDQCTNATNVEFFEATCGERRNGCDPVGLTDAGFAGLAAVVHLSQWFPTGDPTDAEWFAVAATVSGSVVISRRLRPLAGGTWSQITPVDAISTTSTWTLSLPNIYRIQAQPSQGIQALNFIAYASAVDRLHVWNGTTLRRSGLSQPVNSPLVVDYGAGSYAGTRYLRIRYIEMDSSGSVIRRSEPSTSTMFAPSGSGAATTITRPSLLGEGETHWELEGSADNSLFYRLGRVPVSGNTTNDAIQTALGYAAAGPLSEDIGDYLTIPSVAYVAVDEDRLIVAGHQTDQTRMSSVYWTPRITDPGVGNNERLPLDVNNTLNLDNSEGGPITGLTSTINGIGHIFKWSRIYPYIRTNDISKAYEIGSISTTIGALPGSVVRGQDENGSACDYFLDPAIGPCRVALRGIEIITGLRNTWDRINTNAHGIIAHGVYYHSKQQVHWWVAADGGSTPSLKFVLQVDQTRRSEGNTVEGCWALGTGRIAAAYCSALLTEPVTIAGVGSLSTRPFIGLTTPDFVQRCDVNSTDALVPYTPTITTRPFLLNGLLGKWGAMVGTLLASANATRPIKVKLIRDMGKETTEPVSVDLSPEGVETLVIKEMDDLHLSTAHAIQIQITE